MPKVIQMGAKSSTASAQVVQLPLVPTQDKVIDMFFDGATIPEIACACRISATKVLAVIRAHSMIHHRQSVVGLLEAGPWVREQYRRIHSEVISEMSTRAAQRSARRSLRSWVRLHSSTPSSPGHRAQRTTRTASGEIGSYGRRPPCAAHFFQHKPSRETTARNGSRRALCKKPNGGKISSGAPRTA